MTRIALALSGGVDSAVSAYLLKKQGFLVSGFYMTNWNDEHSCNDNVNFRHAQHVANTLDIPLTRLNYVKEYWNNVFQKYLSKLHNGYTPNPDIHCNQFIKFGEFYNQLSPQYDYIATGHYAQIIHSNNQSTLVRAVDKTKDQSYFLSTIKSDILRRVMFPLGSLHKSHVKEICRSIGLAEIADKPESMGICFIGKRRFGSFIDEYIDSNPGNFIDMDGNVVAKHNGIHHYTIGQKAKIQGKDCKYYVAKKLEHDIIVVPGRDHPALFNISFDVIDMVWIYNEPEIISNGFDMNCSVKYIHCMQPVDCVISRRDGVYHVEFTDARPSIVPGQNAAFYIGETCIGGGSIC